MIDDAELQSLKDSIFQWEEDSLPLIEEIKKEVTTARRNMDSDPPDLYSLSNNLVDLSILNIRLVDRIIMARYSLNTAKGLYEQRREGWKVKLAQGYKDGDKFIDGVAAGVADSMKISKVKEEFEVLNQAEYNFDMVNLTRKAVEKSLDAIRSKLSYEKSHET